MALFLSLMISSGDMNTASTMLYPAFAASHRSQLLPSFPCRPMSIFCQRSPGGPGGPGKPGGPCCPGGPDFPSCPGEPATP